MVEVVLVQCNLVYTEYQQIFEILHPFPPNKCYAYLLDVWPCNLVFLKTSNADFVDIEIKFTDKNGRLLEIEDKVNLVFLTNK